MIKKPISLLFAVIFAGLSLTYAGAAEKETEYKMTGRAIYISEDGYVYDDGVHGYQKDKASGKRALLGSNNLPASYDARNDNLVTVVKNQQTTGTCWAHAFISTLESDAVKKGWETKDSADFSEAHLAWATYTPLTGDDDINKGESTYYAGESLFDYGGNYDVAAATLIRGSGLNDEADYPFSNDESAMMYSQEDMYVNNGYTLGNLARLNSAEEVKQWILDHGSVYTSYNASGSFKSGSYNNERVYTRYKDTEVRSNHASAIIGWDDNFPKDLFNPQPSSDGAWLVKNSWGKNWGVKGCFWLSYEDASIFEFCGIEVDRIDYEQNHTYNGAAPGYYYIIENQSEGENVTAYQANVFKLDTDQVLNGVSFYTAGYETSATIKINRIGDEQDLPSSGVRIYSKTVPLDFGGFHRIKTDSGISLPAGVYAVIVELESPTKAYLYIEHPFNGCTTYTASENQSYYSRNGRNWTDTTSWDNGNFYINMYTSHAHNYVSETVPATCTEPGSVTGTCSICGDRSLTEIPAQGHDITRISVPATCTGRGYNENKCARCGFVESYEDLSPLGHKVDTEITPPTCTQDGVSKKTCKVCNEVLEKQILPATGHNAVNETAEPTCTSDGYVISRCRDCGTVLSRETRRALGHTYEEYDKTETDSSITYTYRCSRCGEVTEKTTETTSRKVVSLADILRILFARIRIPFRFRISGTN